MTEPAPGHSPPPEAGSDAAWVRIPVPLPPAELAALLEPERLLRINPLLEIRRWERLDEDRFGVEAFNRSNGLNLATELLVTRHSEGLRMDYGTGLKAATLVRFEPAAKGESTLWIVERYDRHSPEERVARIAEVDRSITAWGVALQHHFAAWRRWSRLPLWRWYICRIHLPMTPTARRTVRLIFWTSVLELLLFAVLLLVWIKP